MRPFGDKAGVSESVEFDLVDKSKTVKEEMKENPNPEQEKCPERIEGKTKDVKPEEQTLTFEDIEKAAKEVRESDLTIPEGVGGSLIIHIDNNQESITKIKHLLVGKSIEDIIDILESVQAEVNMETIYQVN